MASLQVGQNSINDFTATYRSEEALPSNHGSSNVDQVDLLDLQLARYQELQKLELDNKTTRLKELAADVQEKELDKGSRYPRR